MSSHIMQETGNKVVISNQETLKALSLIQQQASKEKEFVRNLLLNLPKPIDSKINIPSFELLGILTKSVPYKNIQLTFKDEDYKEEARGIYMRTFIPKIKIFNNLLNHAQEFAHGDSILIHPYPTILQYGITIWIFEEEAFCQKIWKKLKGKVDSDVWKEREDGSYEKISIYQDFVEGFENLCKHGYDYSSYTIPDYED